MAGQRTQPQMIIMTVPDNPQVLAAIGAVAIRHGQLEHILRMTVKTIAGITVAEANDALRTTGARDLRDRIRKLAKKRLGEGTPLVRLEALLGRSQQATARRNDLLHSLWAQVLDGPNVFRRQDGTWAEPDVAALNELATELATIATELNTARLEGFLHDALAALTRP